LGSFTNGGSDTFRTRKNGANGNQVVTVNATGVFEDNTNTDSISATDKFCYQLFQVVQLILSLIGLKQ